jgi:hypothetical protein
MASRPATVTALGVPRPTSDGCAPLPSPDPPGSSWWCLLERRSDAGSSRTPSRLACRTRTISGAGPSRRCRGCCPPFLASPRSGCPQLHQPAATGWRRCPFITARSCGASWRSMSVTQSWSGSARANSRSTRSPTVGVWCFERGLRAPESPARLARRINMATALWPTVIPWPSTSSVCTRRAPQVLRDSRWTRVITSVSQA